MNKLRFKLTIAYDGSGYSGWQVQTTGVGVQQRIEEALLRLFPHAGRLHSSSRTDTGVHALGMVAHVEIPSSEFKMPVPKLALALNAHLPEDIRIMRAVRCRSDFHARFDAVGKQYRYLVWNHLALNPLIRHQAWLVTRPLDFELMDSASRQFLGTHDFVSFAGVRNYKLQSTERTIWRCDIKRQGPLVTFVIEGDGFLYKMCRGIVGTLVQVGQRKFRPEDIRRMLESKDRRAAGMTAPAQGLILWKVFYSHQRNSRVRKPSFDTGLGENGAVPELE